MELTIALFLIEMVAVFAFTTFMVNTVQLTVQLLALLAFMAVQSVLIFTIGDSAIDAMKYASITVVVINLIRLVCLYRRKPKDSVS